MTALKEGTRSARQDALKILGQVKDPRSVEAVKAGLRYPDEFVRQDAMDALVALNPPDLDECLRRMLDDKEWGIRYSAAIDFGRLKGARAIRSVERLITAARDDGHEMVRRGALEALREIGDPRSVDVALAALKDPDDMVRAGAIKLLGRMKAPRWTEAVQAMLKDRDGYVRYRAMEVLAEANAPKLGDCLRQTLMDDEVRVADGLGDADVAIAVLQASDAWVRAAALKVLARIKDPKSVEAVAKMLEDPEDLVRREAVEALAELNPPDLADRLRPMILEEKDHYVHDAVLRVLRASGKPMSKQPEKR
jgi:HEAT repeat protein